MRSLLGFLIFGTYLSCLGGLLWWQKPASLFGEAERSIASIHNGSKVIIFSIDQLTSSELLNSGLKDRFVIEHLIETKKGSEIDFLYSDFVMTPKLEGEKRSFQNQLQALADFNLNHTQVKSKDVSLEDDFIRLQNFLAPIGPKLNRHLSILKSFNQVNQTLIPGFFPRFRQAYYIFKERFSRNIEMESLPKFSFFEFKSLSQNSPEVKEQKKIQSISQMISSTINYLYDLGFEDELVVVVLGNGKYLEEQNGAGAYQVTKLGDDILKVTFNRDSQTLKFYRDSIELLDGQTHGPLNDFSKQRISFFKDLLKDSHRGVFPDGPYYLQKKLNEESFTHLSLKSNMRDSLIAPMLIVGKPLNPVKGRRKLRKLARLPRSVDIQPSLKELFFLNESKLRDPGSGGELYPVIIDFWD